MGKVILAITLIVALIIVVGLIIWAVKHHTRHEDKVAGRAVDGDLNSKEEQRIIELLNDAANLFKGLGTNTQEQAFSDPEIIRGATRAAIAAWETRYRKVLVK